eukprot:663143-Rhodomonas_salina.4
MPLQVLIGSQPCLQVTLVTDRELTCTSPRLRGPASIQVRVREGGVLRVGTLDGPAFHAVELFFGGTLPGQDPVGFLAIGPGSVLETDVNPADENRTLARGPGLTQGPDGAVVDVVRIRGAGTVQAMAMLGDSLVVAGSFGHFGGQLVGNVFSWNGNTVQALGFGVDGAVKAAVVFRGGVVVAGRFMRAFQSRGGAVSTGGVALWVDGAWSKIGAWTGEGSVSAAIVNLNRSSTHNSEAEAESREVLYIGGSFVDAITSGCEAVCRYDGEQWMKIGSGRFVGSVEALAISGEVLYVGGALVMAGGVNVKGLAAWDGRQWSSLGEVQCCCRGNWQANA